MKSATTKSGTDRLKDTTRITDIVADTMHRHCPSWSIDTLLWHPHLAIRIASAVCRTIGRKATEDAIAEILHIALNSRKRGNLKRDRV
jgi:hypothetical protein